MPSYGRARIQYSNADALPYTGQSSYLESYNSRRLRAILSPTVSFTAHRLVESHCPNNALNNASSNRLIAFTAQANKRMYANRLETLPSLLEFLGFVFFPGAVLVGPVFDLKSYRAYIRQEGVREGKGVRGKG